MMCGLMPIQPFRDLWEHLNGFATKNTAKTFGNPVFTTTSSATKTITKEFGNISTRTFAGGKQIVFVPTKSSCQNI